MRRFRVSRLDSIGRSDTMATAAFPRDAVRAAFPDCGELRSLASPSSPELFAHGGTGSVNVLASHDDCRYLVEDVGEYDPIGFYEVQRAFGPA